MDMDTSGEEDLNDLASEEEEEEEEEGLGHEVEEDEETEEEEAEDDEGLPPPPEKPTKKTRAQLLEEEEEPPTKAVGSKRENVLDFTNVQNLSNFLSQITLAWPEDRHKYSEKLYNAEAQFQGYPKTYFHNSDKEKAIFWHAENFRQQFQFLYPDRRPLFLAPRNECGFQKLFPTYIKPRLLPYPQLFYADTCVEYLKDFFNNDFLQPSTDPPKQVRSPFSVLRDRKANCYEHSLILATCLIGGGYRAYVVDGYATKEVTTLCALEDFTDNFQENEDHFKEDLQVKESDRPAFLMSDLEDESLLREEDVIRPVSRSKYQLHAKKHFISAYQEMMKEREDGKRREEEEKQREEELKQELENQVPPEVDLLLGFRVHAWVLILPGTNAVTEPFFLEPFTGTKRELTDDAFLGIESVFNHKNYWVNLQNCATGIGDLNYDLENGECWAKLLQEPNLEKRKEASTPGQIQISLDEEEEDEIQVPEMYLDMPVSWTVDMFITPKEFKMKYPNGTKTFDYSDAMVERAAPYAQPDGMVQKVLKFSGDGSRKDSNLVYIDERFDRRVDHLFRREFFPNGRIIHEYFAKGRPDSLKEHVFVAGKNKPHSPRILYYHSGWHPENVASRQVLPNGLIETFENRKDRLIYRETIFGGVLCITVKEKLNKTDELKESLGKGDNSRQRRIILGIIEKFSRDPSKKACDDIAEKHMMIAHARIRLLYHYGEDNYTRATLEFFKPETSKIRRDVLKFHPDNCTEFHVDAFTPPLNNYKKSVILARLISEEQRIMDEATRSEDEIIKTVTGRIVENWIHKLDNDKEISPEDAEDLPKTPVEEVPEEEEEEEDKDVNEVIDFASPYLIYGEPKSKGEEIELKKRIMTDAKNRFTRRAESIAICYHEEGNQLKHILSHGCTDLEKRIAEEENFVDCFQRTLSRLHVMEKKMIRYQAKAPRDYCNLLIKVLQHPKLNKYARRDEIRARVNRNRGDNLKLLEFAYKLKAETHASCCQLDYVFDFSRGTYEEEEGSGDDDDYGSDDDGDDDDVGGDDFDQGYQQEQARQKLSLKEKEAKAHMSKQHGQRGGSQLKKK